MKNSQNKGFTVPEVILIVSALAIVSAMAMPDIAYFLGRQTVEQEKLSLANVQKALDSYARECRRLPALANNPSRSNCQDPFASGDGLPWYDALAAFSNMSANGIRNDVWGNERLYTHDTNTRGYREGDVVFHYATVRSAGPDRKNGLETVNVADDWITGISDWEINSGDLSEYETFAQQGDDLMVKYTDSQWKVEAQDESVERMQRIISALDRYAQARYNEEVHANVGCISEKIFYPPSHSAEPTAHSNPNHPTPACRNLGTDIENRYGQAVLNDVQNITGSSRWLNTETTADNTRKVNMEVLMRVLGLPEDHCCSAITNLPFYYYSNPPGSTGTYPTLPPFFTPQVRVDPIF